LVDFAKGSYIAYAMQEQYKIMDFKMERKRRSESLSKEEHKAFIKFFHSFQTKLDAEEEIGIKRQVLDLVAIKGSGSPETIGKIRKALNAA
jgi:hypothetical protein